MKFDPLRKTTQPTETQLLLPTDGKDTHHPDSFDIDTTTKGMCEHPAENDAQSPMTPIHVTLDHSAHTTPEPGEGTGLIASWDDLVQRGVGLGDGLGAPAALDPDGVMGQEREAQRQRVEVEQQRIKTWEELVRVQAVLGEDGSDELEMQRKESLWKLF